MENTITNEKNPIGLMGIASVEFAAPTEEGMKDLHKLFMGLGCSRTHRHMTWDADLYTQREIRFLLTRHAESQATHFAREHGPCISSMGWWVEDADQAIKSAIARGATAYHGPSPYGAAPAIFGIGDSIIYFLEKGRGSKSAWQHLFLDLESPDKAVDRGFVLIDHLTNNVEKGTMKRWADFYKGVFGFTEVRYFDIKGEKTGLTSYALRSPDGSFCIPINEGNEKKSQIEEYLREYQGPGIQHLALLSEDLLTSLDGLGKAGIPTLDIDHEYYETVFDRVPNVSEDHARIQDLEVLVDGDEEGYLLQIFTKNVIGPIFFEMIQRRNHHSFGEGNFSALFRSIERDQERRGAI